MYKLNSAGYVNYAVCKPTEGFSRSYGKHRSYTFPACKDTIPHCLVQLLRKFILPWQQPVKGIIYNIAFFLQVFLNVQRILLRICLAGLRNYYPSFYASSSGSNCLATSSPFSFRISISTFFSALSSILLQCLESLTPSSKSFNDFSRESSPLSRASTISPSFFNASSNFISAIK